MLVVSRRPGDEQQPWVNFTTPLKSPIYKAVFISLERVAKSTEATACTWNNSNVRYWSQFRRMHNCEFWT
jgi:hypothetical protein